jgi:hypothetical protein
MHKLIIISISFLFFISCANNTSVEVNNAITFEPTKGDTAVWPISTILDQSGPRYFICLGDTQIVDASIYKVIAYGYNNAVDTVLGCSINEFYAPTSDGSWISSKYLKLEIDQSYKSSDSIRFTFNKAENFDLSLKSSRLTLEQISKFNYEWTRYHKSYLTDTIVKFKKMSHSLALQFWHQGKIYDHKIIQRQSDLKLITSYTTYSGNLFADKNGVQYLFPDVAYFDGYANLLKDIDFKRIKQKDSLEMIEVENLFINNPGKYQVGDTIMRETGSDQGDYVIYK